MIPFRSLYFDNSVVAGRILDVFQARVPVHEVALFFVHGGGWHSGSRTQFHSIMLAYCDLGYDCASTDYRLCGAKVHEQIVDVQDGLGLFARDLRDRGRPTNIALIGSSAGAHLGAMAALLPPATPEEYRITALCLQSTPFTFEPWPDIFPPIWADMQKALGCPYENQPELFRSASPLHHVSVSMPPVFALHAENEHMFPMELFERFAAKARGCGIPVESKTYPNTEHGFFYSLDRWQQKEAFDDIRLFVEAPARANPSTTT